MYWATNSIRYCDINGTQTPYMPDHTARFRAQACQKFVLSLSVIYSQITVIDAELQQKWVTSS